MTRRKTSGGSKADVSTAPASAGPAAAPVPSPASVAQTQDDGASGFAGAGEAVKVLLGSNVLPGLVDIGGAEAQLGTIVAAAHAASGLSVEDWNALTQEEREERLLAQVEGMRNQAKEQAEAIDRQAAADEEEKRLRDEATTKAEKPHAPSLDTANTAKNPYPCTVTVRNNSHLPLVDPVSGVHVQAGGSASLTLHDADYRHRVMENFKALMERNYLPQDKVSIEGLPE